MLSLAVGGGGGRAECAGQLGAWRWQRRPLCAGRRGSHALAPGSQRGGGAAPCPTPPPPPPHTTPAARDAGQELRPRVLHPPRVQRAVRGAQPRRRPDEAGGRIGAALQGGVGCCARLQRLALICAAPCPPHPSGIPRCATACCAWWRTGAAGCPTSPSWTRTRRWWTGGGWRAGGRRGRVSWLRPAPLLELSRQNGPPYPQPPVAGLASPPNPQGRRLPRAPAARR
jgi:hypothetical protein